MKKVLIALFFVFLIPLAVMAVNWIEIGESETGNKHYIDLDNIKYNDNIVYYWKKLVINEKNNIITQIGGSHVSYYKAIDCNNHDHKIIDMILYDSKNNVLEEFHESDPFESIPPDTIVELEYFLLCE